ncbi:MAG: hypothetical protein ACE5GN_03315 [Waddliaceae bacterium]
MVLKISNHNADPLSLSECSDKSDRNSPSKWRKILSKVWSAVKKVLTGLLGAAFFITNPTLFTTGFMVGVIWDKKVQEIIDKITLVWKKQTWGMAILTGIASFFSLQVTWATTSVLFATNLGSKISRKAQSLMPQEKLSFF